MWCRLMKHLIFRELHKNRNCAFPLMSMSNVSKHTNMQNSCWVDSLLVGMLNYNNRVSCFKSIYNLRKNIWNKVNKSSKLYRSKELWYLLLQIIRLILPEFYFRKGYPGRELDTMQHLLPILWYLYIIDKSCLSESVFN